VFHLAQWINWREESRPGDPKPAKVPCAAGGDRIDPHQPSTWLPYEIARALDPEHVGFVLTEADPYFCIDLDNCAEGTGWNALALAVCAMFPGAYVEVSHSGRGLHIFARGALPAGYGTRGPGVECYTRLRFIAVTGRGAQGSPDVEHTAALATFAALYLKPIDVPGATGGEWREGPVPEWKPILDDQELLRRMLTGRASAGVVFQGKASPEDLWYGNVEALAAAFPPDDPKKPYGQSEADAALAARLAFWTGKDCPRIERLMRASALVRPKWDRRGDDYLRRTIIGACAKVARVYTGGQQPAEAVPGTSYPYLTVDAQLDHFAGCCYITTLHRVLMPNGLLLAPDAFRANMGNFDFQMYPDSGKPSKNAFETFTQSRCVTFPKADMLCFRPEHPPGQIVTDGGVRLVNTWVPPVVTMRPGDIGPWLNHMARMVPDERDRAILFSYLAAMKQYPGKKFRWAPVIQGVQGNGKGVFTSVAEYIVGGHLYTHKPNAHHFVDSGSKFTGWLDRKLLILIDEIKMSERRDILEIFKPLITDDRVEIQRKGADQVTGDNRANFIFTTNHRDAVIKTDDDRRYAIFYTAQQAQSDVKWSDDYFPTLYDWLRAEGFAAVAYWLHQYDIPDQLNPATRAHRAPQTSSTAEAIRESLGVVEQIVQEAIDQGVQGFRGGWVSSVRLSDLLREHGKGIAPRKRGALMATLGYEPHPGLPPSGQVHSEILAEGQKRPVLYVRRGSLPAQHPNPAAAYLQAQGYVTAGAVRVPGGG